MSKQIIDLLIEISEEIKELNKKVEILVKQNANIKLDTVSYRGVNRIKSILESANKTKVK